VKPLPVLFAATLLSLAPAACGRSGKNVGGSASSVSNHGAAAVAAGPEGARGVATTGAGPGGVPGAALPQIELKGDPDSDSDTYPGEPDNEHELLGRPVRAGDARAVAALVRRYYAAAARGDGAAACRLIYAPTAEAIPAVYGGPGGPAYLRGKTCAAVLSKLFRHYHKRLSAEDTALRVVAVRVYLTRGSAQFGFGGKKPTRYIMVHRERGAWKMFMMLDVGQPFHVE
jgi:hypothetical protein